MDLARAIADRANRLAQIEREAATVREELEALHKAASILGVSPPKAAEVEQPASRHRGKPQGAISTKWKQIMADMLPVGRQHAYSDVQHLAKGRGIELEISSIRDRVRKFVEAGYLSRAQDNRVSLTDAAVSKFDLVGPQKTSAPSVEEGAESLF